MTRYRVLPYRQGSKGARNLADALGGKVLKLEGSKFVIRQGDILVNWGNTNTPEYFNGRMDLFANGNTHLLRDVTNKLHFFQKMERDNEDIIPKFWTNMQGIPDEAFPIVCRTVLAGHSGDGIVIAADRSELVPCQLYVQYVKKQDEYRIHVGVKNNEQSIISVQRKARRLETPDEEVNWKVRNLAGGFVFVRGGVEPPVCVLEAAKRALECTGLDFGAVDVIYNERQEKAYVLEINTAPGLEGQTVEDYARFFRRVG